MDSLPPEMSHVVKQGIISTELLHQWLHWEQRYLLRQLLRFPGMKERVLGDAAFLMKLGVEAGMGVITKLLAELHKRPVKFWGELDLVFANVVMSLLADVALIWIPAPQASLTPQAISHQQEAVKKDSVSRWLAGCPDNAFQVNQQGSQQYSMAQRWASIIINGILLFLIGFVSSMFGVGVINVLVAVRSFFDSHIEGIEMSQEVLGISVAHGVYMATSGNIRYQVLAGIVEERGVNIMFAHNVRLLRITSSIIRTINTYYGSEHWIVFIRYFGLQDA